MSTPSTSHSLLEPLKRLHETIRQTVVDACERLSMESMAAIAREEEGDTIYAVDYLTEELRKRTQSGGLLSIQSMGRAD